NYPQLMVNIAVYVGQTLVFTFPSNKSDIQNTTVITDNLPLRGSSIKLNETGYVVLCELQADGCVSGRYGAQCQQTCSAGCQSTSCDSITGNCPCNTGWLGAQCRDCVSGSYGAQCQQTCSAGCQSTSCDSITGNCTCNAGWSGAQCR
ncbi:hypothetical protein BaRGS_00039757, partial [Batillaria attramentaria]